MGHPGERQSPGSILCLLLKLQPRAAAFRRIGRTKSSFRRAMSQTQCSISKEEKSKSTVVSKQGKEAVVAMLGADEFLGEGCLIGQPKRLAAAVTMSECTIMRVGKNEIQRLLQDEPAFSQMFVSHILARKDRVEEDLVDQLFKSTEKRLARLLLLLANFGKEGGPEPIIAKISQEVLAEMIGTTRSRVSHFMNKFRELGFIDYNGHLEVHSSLLSVVLNEQGRTVAPIA
jgi:CRP/FNR family transcriptional regulator, cyclic AMP receptor protein